MTIKPVYNQGKRLYLAQEYHKGRLLCSVTGHTHMYALTNAFKELTRTI